MLNISQDFDEMCLSGGKLPLRSVLLEQCLMELKVRLQQSERNLGERVLLVPQYILVQKAAIQMRYVVFTNCRKTLNSLTIRNFARQKTAYSMLIPY